MSHTETGLPEGWEVRRSNTRNLPYYFHPMTKDSRWEPPVGTDPEKLKSFMAENHSTKNISESTFTDKKDEIRCAHLLVKHADSRRPASWREPKITRSKAEAYDIIAAYEKEIIRNTNGEEGARSLSELATTESDCPSARKGGDLGYFGKGDMQKEFEDAAFELEKGAVSSIVSTASGLHLIQRL